MKNLNSENDLPIVALCTNLGDSNAPYNPLTNIQYNSLAHRIYKSSIKSPKNLMDNIDDLDKFWEELKLPYKLKDRIEYLLSPERVTRIYFALEELRRKNIRVITRASSNYPKKLKDKLKEKRPSVIFYIGNLELLDEKIVGIVGSRNIGEEEKNFVKDVAKDLLDKSYTIISGGAKGTDTIAEEYAIKNNGNVILFLSSDMLKKIQYSDVIKHIINEKMLILSESIPNSHFRAYTAMERNKYIYSLSDFVVIAKTDYNKGGTWAGATEAIKNNYCDVIVKDDKSIGFQALIDKGAKVYNNNYEFMINQQLNTATQLSLFENSDD